MDPQIATIVEKLQHAWQALNIHDIGCGLQEYNPYSSSLAVTCLSREIETEALKFASTASVRPVRDEDVDSEYIHEHCSKVISNLLSDETQVHGLSRWPELFADEQESSTCLESTASSITWSEEADKKRIHEGLVEIMKLNLKYADAITEIQQGEEPTLEQSLQIASSTKILNADDFMAHAMQIWTSGYTPEMTRRWPKDQSLNLDGDGGVCIKVLEDERDNVYRFCIDNHTHTVECRFSYDELRQRWKQASKEAQRDNGSFPQMHLKSRKSTSFNDHLQDCTVRCACRKCKNGTPVVWQCKPYEFDEKHQILVHHFVYEKDQHYRNWAYILADWGKEEPAEYRLWGSYLGDPKNITGYNEFFKLEEHVEKPSDSQRQEHVIHHSYATRGRERRSTAGQPVGSGIDVQSMQHQYHFHNTRPNKRSKTTGQWSNVDANEPQQNQPGQSSGTQSDSHDPVPLGSVLPAKERDYNTNMNAEREVTEQQYCPAGDLQDRTNIGRLPLSRPQSPPAHTDDDSAMPVESTTPVEATHIAFTQMQDESPMQTESAAPIPPESTNAGATQDPSTQDTVPTRTQTDFTNAIQTQEEPSTPRQQTTPIQTKSTTSTETPQDTLPQADSTATTQPQPSTTETAPPPPAHPTTSAQPNPNTCNLPPSPTRHQRPPTPAHTPILNPPKLDLSACFRAAFTHLRKQKEDGNWSCVLTTNDTFIGLARDLRIFKERRDEDSFRDMWAETDAELALAGLEALPALDEVEGGGRWGVGG